MATFTALAKILFLENYYNTKIAGLGEILSHENFQLYGTHHDPCSLPEALSHVSLAAEKRVCVVVILFGLCGVVWCNKERNKERKK